MLALIFANRNKVGLIQQDVAGHQYWIAIEARADGVRVLARFRFELGHAVQPTHGSEAVHNPAHLRMLMHM